MSSLSKWILVAALACTGGCATLKTEIAVFDPECEHGERILAIEAIKADLLRDANAAWTASGSKDAEGKKDFDAAIEGILKKIDAAKVAVQIGDFDAAAAEVATAKANYTNLRKMFASASEPVDFHALDAHVKRLSNLSGPEIFADQRLPDVLYARRPTKQDRKKTARKHSKQTNSCWVAVVDETRSTAHGGNGDIAVTLRDDGTFTVKGLRLDAAKLTEAIFKVSTQAVCLVASIYGVGGCSTTKQDNVSDFDLDAAGEEIRTRKRAALHLLEDVVKYQGSAAALSNSIEARLDALSVPEKKDP